MWSLAHRFIMQGPSRQRHDQQPILLRSADMNLSSATAENMITGGPHAIRIISSEWE